METIRFLSGYNTAQTENRGFAFLSIPAIIVRIFSVMFFVFILMAYNSCSKTKDPVLCTWRIETPSMNNPFLSGASELIIGRESILFRNRNISRKYPIILNENQMVIETETTRYLMIIEKPNDTTLVLREKYAKTPCVFHLKK